MLSPGPSPAEIQSHLYSSLLQASAYDVAIRITGTWKAVYKLHRVVLIQSGFFRSLFTAGFSEASFRQGNSNDEIDIVFDDYNITRSAFELCISRLYGGGPPLHVSPSLIPTIAHPLTPPYFGITEVDEVPAGHHPATPSFLLSLLATAIYLSIPAIASQALSLILKSIGPSTVLRYLNFACGKSVLHTYSTDDHTHGAVSLEHLAEIEMLGDVETLTLSTTQQQSLKANRSLISETGESFIPIPTPNTSNSAELLDGGLDHLEGDMPSYHYGAVSDKIGEACSCWLARWATDILQYEEGNDDTRDFEHNNLRMPAESLLHTIDPPRSVSAILRPVIWGRGGLDAKWVSALISADTLFVRNERGRYNFARSVVELRRRDSILDDEEKVWTQMFERDIYYLNMTFEDIYFISQDVSPTTKRPYVPLSVLQASHWTQSVLRNQVTHRPTCSSGSSSPPVRDKELGITLTTTEIVCEPPPTDANKKDRLKLYFPVLGDSSLRVGDNLINCPGMNRMPLSMEELFTSCRSPFAGQPSPSANDEAKSEPAIAVTDKFCATETNFFGLLTPRYTGVANVESDSIGISRWSPYPPCRFSVEFWDVDLLKEKSRLHSHTIWYAGNLFNVYVQIVRKKSQSQLGIYLHRQSNVDPIPAASIHSQPQGIKDGILDSSHAHIRKISFPSPVRQPTSIQNTMHYSPSIHPSSASFTTAGHTRPNSPSSPSSTSDFNLNSIPSTLTPLAPPQPYRDPRSSISAYFAISCASATGTSQTRFSSSPDVFSVSQTWGWKSSALQTEEFVEIGTQFIPTTNIIRSKEISLRATVLVGLI